MPVRLAPKASIAFTGDVDTVAAVALGVGCCSDEVKNDLPDFLYEQLEDGGYGLTYLRKLDAQLLEFAD